MKRTGATYDVIWHGQQGGTLPLQPRMTRKTRAVVAAATWVALGSARSAFAHQAPFSYLDVSVEPKGVHLTLVVHTFDLAHEVQVEPPERILEPDVLRSKSPIFASLLAERLSLTVDGARLVPSTWSAAEAVAERQSVRLEARIDLGRTAGRIGIHAYLFPYDKVHQTFVNVYEGESIRTQAILDVRRQDVQYFASTPRGVLKVASRFVPDGITHILFGPDHLLFLVGLLLLGGTVSQRLWVVSAFTLTHTVALALAGFSIVRPPPRLVDPAIALSIVYVGADNLMVKGGRDVRPWIAAAFGAIHGLGFATVLQGLDLSRSALVWSVLWFNVGVGLGQVVVVSAIATVLAALRSHSEALGKRVAYAGSVAVIAAGIWWFVQKVFFPGGLA